MIYSKIEDMFKGWFIGNFHPTSFQTEACEVALKSYSKGDQETEHFHKIATEITLLVSGKMQMCGRDWVEGSIVVLNPGESTSFKALSDCVTVVVKVPGAQNDKYFLDLNDQK